MIENKQDYLRCLESDRIALGRQHRYGLRDWLFDPIWTYERSMRQLAYVFNVKCACGGGILEFHPAIALS